MLRSLLHIDADSTYKVLGLHWRSGLPIAVVALLVAAVLVYAVVLYLREDKLGRVERTALILCRIAALLLLLFLLGRPVVDIEQTRSTPPNIAVLVDNSQSMLIRDTRREPAQIAEAALAVGQLAFDGPDRQRQVYRATVDMAGAAAALREGKLNQARQAQGRVQEALAQIDRQVQADHSARNRDAAKALNVIAEQQKHLLVRDVGLGDAAARSAAADAQAGLAQALAAWDVGVAEGSATVSDALRAQFGKVSRLELAAGLFRRPAVNIPSEISTQGTPRYFRFATELEPVGDPMHAATTQPADGAETLGGAQLGSAIEEAVNRFNGQSLAGVVLITSGDSAGGADPLEVARAMRERGVPLYPIGIGLPEPDDVALRALVVQDVVFASDLVPLRVQVVSHGYENRQTTLSVSIDGAEVASKAVTLTGLPQFEELTFRASKSPGTHTLEVAIAPLRGQATTQNTRISRSLRVSDKKIKVLCIEGSPRWEFRYLRAVLKRDPRIDPTFIMTEGDRELARASKEHLARFPERPDQVFQYDMVILGDVKANTFTPAQFERMKEMVHDRGASFLLLAGSKHAPAEYLDTPVADMLPVGLEQGKWEDVGDDVYPVLTPEGQGSTVMALDPSEGRNRALWTNVRPLVHVPPLGLPKPDAHVLAELSDSARRSQPLPLISWHRYGTGKVMLIGTDRLWRMRAKTGDEYHARFWGQVVQFLALSRLLSENQRIRIEADHTDALVDQPVAVYASVLNEDYEPNAAHTWNAAVTDLDNGAPVQTLTLQGDPKTPGLYSGFFVPGRTGRYQIGAGVDEQKYANTVDVTVRASSAEPGDAAMNRELLASMAELSGGRYLNIRDLPLLSELLHGTARAQPIHKEVELWDNWLVPVLFVGFVAFEWFCRRRRDLA
jgi:uncharacterized membrane protein